jgi:hypothetical protein
VQNIVRERHRSELGGVKLSLRSPALEPIHALGKCPHARTVVENDVASPRRKEGIIVPRGKQRIPCRLP